MCSFQNRTAHTRAAMCILLVSAGDQNQYCVLYFRYVFILFFYSTSAAVICLFCGLCISGHNPQAFAFTCGFALLNLFALKDQFAAKIFNWAELEDNRHGSKLLELKYISLKKGCEHIEMSFFSAFI